MRVRSFCYIDFFILFFVIQIQTSYCQELTVIELVNTLSNSDLTYNTYCEGYTTYDCEIPPATLPIDDRRCSYRSIEYPIQVYKWVAGRGCLVYTPPFLFVGGRNPINLNAACRYKNVFAPCVEIIKDDNTCGCYPFDPGFPEVSQLVQESMVPIAQGRWESCYQAADDCCANVMNKNHRDDVTYCPATFDAWTCWDSAPAGTVPQAVCTEFAYSNTGPSCNHFSSRPCFENGTWQADTDYSTCSITPRLVARFNYHIIVLSISIACCLPAVFVFFFYKRLRVPRVILHRNLLIAIIIRNVLVIIIRSVVYIDELTNSGDTVMANHSVACRFLAVLERAASSLVFACMLVEGIYLHRLIVAVFKRQIKMKILYAAVVTITIVPVLAWTTVMAMHNDHSCWLVYTVDHVQWILDAPRIAILLINTGLFIDVLRVLLTKIRNSENANQLSTAKATLFLMPVFGTQFLLTAFRPNTRDCTAEDVYFYITYTMEGLQGFIVAMLYCYVNKEVIMLVKATYRKTETAVVSRVRRDSTYHRSVGDRRMTFSTGLEPQMEDPEPIVETADIISLKADAKRAHILEPIYETAEISTNTLSAVSTTSKNSSIDKENSLYGSMEIPATSESAISSEDLKYYGPVAVDNDVIILLPTYVNIPIAAEDDRNGTVENAGQSNSVDLYSPDSILENINPNNENMSMLEEIMQYIENNDILFDSNAMAPNRKDEDKIIFVD